MTTFKQYLNGDVIEEDNPFSIREIEGQHWDWKTNDKLEFEGHSILLNPEPYLRLKVKSGFLVDLRLKSEDWNGYNSMMTAFHNNGVDELRIDKRSTGIGGSDIVTFRMVGGDELVMDWDSQSRGIGDREFGGVHDGLWAADASWNNSGKILMLNLRRDETEPSGGYTVYENQSASADVILKLQSVGKYTELVTGVEGDTEESDSTVEGVEVDESLDPRTDDSNMGNQDNQDKHRAELAETEPIMGLFMLAAMGAILSTIAGVAGS